MERQPKVLASGLHHGTHAILFWALTLIYNARRQPFGAPLQPAREYGPLALPSANVWRQAWTAALAMDQPAVTPLLVACYQNEQDQKKREPVVCAFPFHCPLAWRAPN